MKKKKFDIYKVPFVAPDPSLSSDISDPTTEEVCAIAFAINQSLESSKLAQSSTTTWSTVARIEGISQRF